MTQSLSQKIQEFVALLHASALSDGIKQAIIDNADRLTEVQIDAVIASLKKEQDALETLKGLMEQHERLTVNREKQIREETRSMVQQHIDEFMESIKESA